MKHKSANLLLAVTLLFAVGARAQTNVIPADAPMVTNLPPETNSINLVAKPDGAGGFTITCDIRGGACTNVATVDSNGVASAPSITGPLFAKLSAQAAQDKAAADSQAQASFQNGFAAGVRAAEQLRLEEALPNTMQKAALLLQRQNPGAR